MAKGPIEREKAGMFQNQVEVPEKTPLQRTRVETGGVEGSNLRVKREMARELAAMGFGQRMVERLLNMGVEKVSGGKRGKEDNRTEA